MPRLEMDGKMCGGGDFMVTEGLAIDMITVEPALPAHKLDGSMSGSNDWTEVG